MIPKDSDSQPPFNPYFALLSGVLAVSTGAIFARLAEAPALVIAAYSSGTPAYGMRAGNPVIIMADDTDLADAADKITISLK